MKTFEVIAEFVDAKTGERISPALPGEGPVTFVPHDPEQASRLIAANCLIEAGADCAAPAEPVPPPAPAPEPQPAPTKPPAARKPAAKAVAPKA